MENTQSDFKERRDNPHSRYRRAWIPEEKQKGIRKIQTLSIDARRYSKVVSPIAARSLREAASKEPEKPFMSFGRMMKANP
jgi:hypothetical protein